MTEYVELYGQSWSSGDFYMKQQALLASIQQVKARIEKIKLKIRQTTDEKDLELLTSEFRDLQLLQYWQVSQVGWLETNFNQEAEDEED